MSTIADIRSLIWDLTRDPQNRIRSSPTVDRAINSAYKRIQQDLYGMLDADSETTINWIANTWLYTLPTDNNFIEVVKREGKTLERTTRKDVYEIDTVSTTSELPAWTPDQYYTTDWSIWLYPVPDTAWSIKIIYSWLFSPLSDANPTLSTQSFCDNAIVYYATSILNKQIMRLDVSQVREQEYMKEITKARLQLLKDNNMTFKYI